MKKKLQVKSCKGCALAFKPKEAAQVYHNRKCYIENGKAPHPHGSTKKSTKTTVNAETIYDTRFLAGTYEPLPVYKSPSGEYRKTVPLNPIGDSLNELVNNATVVCRTENIRLTKMLKDTQQKEKSLWNVIKFYAGVLVGMVVIIVCTIFS